MAEDKKTPVMEKDEEKKPKRRRVLKRLRRAWRAVTRCFGGSSSSTSGVYELVHGDEIKEEKYELEKVIQEEDEAGPITVHGLVHSKKKVRQDELEVEQEEYELAEIQKVVQNVVQEIIETVVQDEEEEEARSIKDNEILRQCREVLSRTEFLAEKFLFIQELLLVNDAIIRLEEEEYDEEEDGEDKEEAGPITDQPSDDAEEQRERDEEKANIAFFIQDDEISEEDMQKRYAAFLLKMQKREEERLLRKAPLRTRADAETYEDLHEVDEDLSDEKRPGPKKHRERPSRSSNKALILSALFHNCLAGKSSEKQRNVIMDEVKKCDSKHYIILLRDGLFRAVYSYNPGTEDIWKVTGKGPKYITSKMIGTLFMYSSDRKQFAVFPASKISICVDAVTIDERVWQSKRQALPDNNLLLE